MTTHNTGNPVPSGDAKDRFDNTQVLDELLNSPLATAIGRLGKALKTWAGIEAEFEDSQAERDAAFQAFLDDSGWSSLGDYAAGINIISHTQTVDYQGQPYTLKASVQASVANPYVTTGDWSTEGDNFKLVGDSTLRQDLSAPGGIGLVSGGDFSAATVSSALFETGPQTLESLFSQALRLDKVQSLSPNNPSADDSALLSAICAVAGDNGVPLDGGGATFYGRATLSFHPNQRARNFKWKLTGPGATDTSAKAHIPATSMVGVADATPVFVDIESDGGRSTWPNISMSSAGPEGGGSEDGGMHAWRITGFAQNGLWVRCRGVNAATAGWAIHNPLPSTTVLTYQKRNLRFIDCDGIGNREHGMFADSFKGIKWLGGSLTGNGLDLNTDDPLEHGSRGARDTEGKLFGMPFDLESYGPNFLGSMFTDFLMRSTDCRGNAIMATIYNPIVSSMSGFEPSRNIRLLDCQLDKGSATGTDRATGTADLALNVLGNKADVATFSDVTVHCSMSGRAQFNGVTKLDMSAGFIEALSPKAIINNCAFYDASCAGLTDDLQIFPAITITVTKTGGAAGAAFAPSVNSTRAMKGCSIQQVYKMQISGAVASGGTVTANITPPAGYLIRDIDLSVVTSSTGKPVLSSHLINGAGGSASIHVDASNDTLLASVLTVHLLQSV